MTVTDVQVVDLLDSAGPLTAGQLAELTGLTTGAITGMLNRLEEAGLVRRERDPSDARRVIVRLVSHKEDRSELDPFGASMDKAWAQFASCYDDEQIAFLLDFLRSGNELSRQELTRLREAPQVEESVPSVPLGDVTSGRLVVPAGILRLTMRAGHDMTELYQARFEGFAPDVKVEGGVVTIRYPRRLWARGSGSSAAEVTLNAAIPWQIEIRGGASLIVGELGGLDLAGMEFKGGMSMVRLELPVPSRVVPIHLSGGASEVTVRRPAGVPARVHLKGWASAFVFDDQRFSYLGNDVRLQSPGYDGTVPGYDIEVASSVSAVTITAGDAAVH